MHMSSNPTEIVKESDGTLAVKLEPVSKDKGSAGAAGADSTASEIRGNDTVVLAVGRAGKTKGLGLEEVGVEMGPKGSVKVDEFSRTNIPNIWACGDVTSRIALTPVAIMEGQAIGDSIGTGHLEAPAYDAVPSACFSYPFVATVVSGGRLFAGREAAGPRLLLHVRVCRPRFGDGGSSCCSALVSCAGQVAVKQLEDAAVSGMPTGNLLVCPASLSVCTQGLTEQQVVQQGLKAEVYTSTFTPLKARLAARAEGAVLQQGLVKMLVEQGSGKVLGLHMVGEDAPEIVQVR
jgi:pyruvate/2-oxoglutarate dehydrogenase complex dihydrolipoamide dehydrogenase (E3) component